MNTFFKSTYLPYCALLCAMIIWASSFIGLKIAFVAYHPIVVVFARMVLASICFLLLYRYTFKDFKYHRGDAKLILFMSFCEPCLYFIFEGIALVNTSAAQAGVITATAPIFTLVAASFFLQERYNLKSWIGSVIALIGVCWMTLASTPDSFAPRPILGNFFELLAMICATGYTITIKKLSSRYSPLFLTATQSFVGALFYLPLLGLPMVKLPDTFPLASSLATCYLGIVVTLGGYGLFNYALKKVPASRATSFINLISVFSVIMAWLILGERLLPSQIAASVLILLAVFYTQKQMSYPQKQ